MNERGPMFHPGQPEMPDPENMDAQEFQDRTDDTIVPPVIEEVPFEPRVTEHPDGLVPPAMPEEEHGDMAAK